MKHHNGKEVIGIRKLDWDQLWHVIYEWHGMATKWERVTKEVAFHVMGFNKEGE